MWTGALGPDGYGVFRADGKNRRAHRVAWEIHNGPVPDGLYVLHRCDIRNCVNASKCLFLGTHEDNMRDKMEKGRQAAGEALSRALSGENSGCNKVTTGDVIAIRSSVGITQRALARRYGVSQQTIWDIRSRRRWRHVP